MRLPRYRGPPSRNRDRTRSSSSRSGSRSRSSTFRRNVSIRSILAFVGGALLAVFLWGRLQSSGVRGPWARRVNFDGNGDRCVCVSLFSCGPFSNAVCVSCFGYFIFWVVCFSPHTNVKVVFYSIIQEQQTEHRGYLALCCTGICRCTHTRTAVYTVSCSERCQCGVLLHSTQKNRSTASTAGSTSSLLLLVMIRSTKWNCHYPACGCFSIAPHPHYS